MLFRFFVFHFFLFGYLGHTEGDIAQAERPNVEIPNEQELQEDSAKAWKTDSQTKPQSPASSEDKQHQFNPNEIEVRVPPGIVPEENKLGAIKVSIINNVPILVQRVQKDDFSPGAFRAFNLDAIEKKLKSYVSDSMGFDFEEDKKVASVLDRLGVHTEDPLNVWNLEIVGHGKSGATHLYDGDVLRNIPEYIQNRLPLIQLLKLQELPGVVKIKRILKSNGGKLFITMEKLSKNSLNFEKVSEETLTEIVDFFARFLVELNKRGVYHSDLHCSNLMSRGNELVIIDYDSFHSGQHENLEFAMCILRSRFENYYRNKIKGFNNPASKLLASLPKSYYERFISSLSMQKSPCIETNPSLSFFSSTRIIPYLPAFELYADGCDACSEQMTGCFTNWPGRATFAGVDWFPVVPMVYYWYQRVFDQFEKVLNYSESEFQANWKKLNLESRKMKFFDIDRMDYIHSWLMGTFGLKMPSSDKQKRLVYAVYLASEALGSDPTKTLKAEAFNKMAKFGSTEAALVKVVQGEMTLMELVSALSR